MLRRCHRRGGRRVNAITLAATLLIVSGLGSALTAQGIEGSVGGGGVWYKDAVTSSLGAGVTIAGTWRSGALAVGADAGFAFLDDNRELCSPSEAGCNVDAPPRRLLGASASIMAPIGPLLVGAGPAGVSRIRPRGSSVDFGLQASALADVTKHLQIRARYLRLTGSASAGMTDIGLAWRMF